MNLQSSMKKQLFKNILQFFYLLKLFFTHLQLLEVLFGEDLLPVDAEEIV